MAILSRQASSQIGPSSIQPRAIAHLSQLPRRTEQKLSNGNGRRTPTLWLALLLVLLLLLPAWTSFYVGSLRLTAYRVLLLTTFIPSVTALFSGRIGKVLWCDWLMMLHVVWAALALGVVHDFGTAIQSGGIYAIEAFGAYLLGRWCVRSVTDMRAVILLSTCVVIALAVFTVPESVTGKHILNPQAVSIGRRLGLERAYGPFEHPILYGVFCASAIGFSWYILAPGAGRSMQLLRMLLIILSTAMSVSSGAMAAMMTQFIIIVWEECTRKMRRRWKVFASIWICLYVFVSIFSNRPPLTVALYYLTFSPETAYGRIIIWDGGMESIQAHPIFGIGFNDWNHPTWMSGSMDNFWLYTAVAYGVMGFIGIGGAALYIARHLARLRNAGPAVLRARMGWMINVAGLSSAACTVHFWNSLFVYFCLLLGTGVWMAERSTLSE